MSGKRASGAKPRRVRRNREDDVLKAAVEVFHRKGYATASIQDVAESVGVLKGSLYHYIDSKEDLLARIFTESDDQSQVIIKEIVALDVSAAERLWLFARAWSLWYLENAERSSLYFNEWRHLTGERRRRIMKHRHDYEAFVQSLIEATIRSGEARPGLDARYASYLALSAINALPNWYSRSGSDSAEHIASVWADLVAGVVCEEPHAHAVGGPVHVSRPPATGRAAA